MKNGRMHGSAVRILVGLALALHGCGPHRQAPDGRPLPQFLEGELQPPPPDDAAAAARLRELNTLVVNDYRIGPGDRFDIHVYDEEDLSTEGTMVKQDGTLSMKLAGEIPVLNLTIPEATARMEDKLREYLKHPKVSLIPAELRSATFTIIGKVKKPGTYPVQHNSRILDAIAVSGGFTTGIFQNNTVEMADLEHAYISRDNAVLPVDFAALIRNGDMRHNIPLADGDYLYIPSAMNREVYVLGEVVSPGFFGYKENLTLLQILARAKGLKKTASAQAAIIRGGLRHPRVYSHNIHAIIDGKARDVKLEPDDIVVFPQSVLGAWNTVLDFALPSLQALNGGLNLFDPAR